MSKSKFICMEEIEGRKRLINTEQINYIAQEKDGSTTIYFDGGDFLCMKASFDDVAEAIERSNNEREAD